MSKMQVPHKRAVALGVGGLFGMSLLSGCSGTNEQPTSATAPSTPATSATAPSSASVPAQATSSAPVSTQTPATSASVDTTPAVPATKTPAAKTDPVDVAMEYFGNLDFTDPDALQAMQDAAEPGSLAGLFARNQAKLAEAETNTRGIDLPTYEANRLPNGSGVKACDENRCTEYTNIKLDPSSGKLVSFDIGGHPLDKSIIRAGGGNTVDRRVIYKATSSYVGPVSAYLFVFVEMTNNSKEPADGADSEASYAVNGRQYQATAVYGPEDVQPGVTATYVYVFKNAKPLGGTLQIYSQVSRNTEPVRLKVA